MGGLAAARYPSSVLRGPLSRRADRSSDIGGVKQDFRTSTRLIARRNNMKTTRSVLTLSTAMIAAFGIGAATNVAADRPALAGNDGGSKACVRSQHHLDRNVQTVVAYYTLSFNAGLPRLAVEKYVGVDENGNKTYTQHNPFAQDGPEAFIAFVEFFKGLYPDLHVDIKRTIAQCDLVMTHSHITTGPDDIGDAAMDIFRLDDTGRIVEHWDAVQPVEPNPANDNTMF
jgi:predicted SnoaL-like aldol condensation-catalyzing enzyme